MTKTSSEKRRYTKLDEETWATIRTEWESGDTTLAELADRFETSIRSLQNFFEKHGVVKGSTRQAAALEAVRLATSQPVPADATDPETAKASTLARIVAVEAAIADQLAIVQADPSQAFRAGSAVKMLAAAADALSKTYNLKRAILGLDRPETEVRTVLEIRELFSDEIEDLRNRDEDEGEDDEELSGRDDDNEIVLEELNG